MSSLSPAPYATVEPSRLEKGLRRSKGMKPYPTPATSSSPSAWEDQTRLRYDAGARKTYDMQSAAPGDYITETPGYYWCPPEWNYTEKIVSPGHFPKEYRNACSADTETKLTHSVSTNPKLRHQVFARPYLGNFMGAGMPSLDKKELESDLIYGLDTRGGPRKACDVLSGVNIDRFEYLPEYGNPQRVVHVIPQWVWGGVNTRDYVRKVEYDEKCMNVKQKKLFKLL